MKNNAIGVYDSGLGGLSVVRELMDWLPHESILYVADSARVPYGPRSQSEIVQFNQETIEFLLTQGVKLIISACNTSSALALPYIKNISPVPVMGMIEAGATLPANTKRAGLIATEGTIRSQAYRQAVHSRYPHVQFYELACPDFVPMIEQGHWRSSLGLDVVMKRLLPLREKHLDKLILGCTHYAYLRRHIQSVLGSQVQLLDPACQIASQTDLWLKTQKMAATQSEPVYRFCTTGSPATFQRLAEDLRIPVARVEHIVLAKQLSATPVPLMSYLSPLPVPAG